MSNQRVTPIPDKNAPLNGSMIIIWIFAWLALVLDVLDWQLVSVSASIISAEFHIPASMMGFVLGAPLLGAGLGGLISGVLSDKFGRVRVMFYCLIWYSLFTIAFAYAKSVEMMIILRILVGIGLGAQWGVGNTLVAECLPARMRIMCSAVIQTGFAFGPMLAAFLAKAILPNYGWRPLFWFGAIGFVVATNRDLETMVAQGKFREDLYYRLNVIPICIPPLRERQEDIPAFLHFFKDKFNLKYKTEKSFSPQAFAELVNYSWPGNVRQLANLVERLVVTCVEDMIDIPHLPEQVLSKDKVTILSKLKEFVPLKEAVREVEKQLICLALKKYDNTYEAAKALGISQPTMSRKANKYST